MSREVPEGWTQTEIAKVADINPESLPSNTSADFLFKYIDVATVDGPSIMLEPRSVSFGDAPSRARRKVQQGDILVSTVRPYLRAFCKVSSRDPRLVASTAFAVLRPNAIVNGDFLYQHILWDRFVEHLTPRMTGSNYPAVTAGDVGAYALFVPPLHEQRRIAKILSSVDEAIAATRAVIEQTRKVKQGVLERLLTKGISHTRFKQTEIGEIPEGWEVVRLNHIAERTTYGFTNPMSTVEDGPWMITAANILEGKINYKSARKTDRVEFETLLSEKSKPAENTVLITKDGTLGRVAIVDKGDLCINQSVAAVTPNESRILPRFLYWLLQSPSVQTRILAEAGGSTIKHIYISKLAETVLQLPPLNEQEEIVRNIDLVELSLEREHMRARSERLERVRCLSLATLSPALSPTERACRRRPCPARVVCVLIRRQSTDWAQFSPSGLASQKATKHFSAAPSEITSVEKKVIDGMRIARRSS